MLPKPETHHERVVCYSTTVDPVHKWSVMLMYVYKLFLAGYLCKPGDPTLHPCVGSLVHARWLLSAAVDDGTKHVDKRAAVVYTRTCVLLCGLL